MMVPAINNSQSHLNTRSATLGNSIVAFTRGREIPHSESDTTRLNNVMTGLGKTEQVKSSANVLAKQIQVMDTQVQSVAQHIQRMTTDIRTFRKNFPPFPRGSEEWERLLNSFQGIRKLIERLTFPPKKEAVPLFQDHGAAQPDFTIHLVERFETLLQDIATFLPHIPENTSDVAFQELEEKLGTLLDYISQQLAEFIEQKKYFEDTGDTDMAVQMEFFSITIGQTFSDQSDWQTTVSQTHLKALQV